VVLQKAEVVRRRNLRKSVVAIEMAGMGEHHPASHKGQMQGQMIELQQWSHRVSRSLVVISPPISRHLGQDMVG